LLPNNHRCTPTRKGQRDSKSGIRRGGENRRFLRGRETEKKITHTNLRSFGRGKPEEVRVGGGLADVPLGRRGHCEHNLKQAVKKKGSTGRRREKRKPNIKGVVKNFFSMGKVGEKMGGGGKSI